MRKLKRGLLLGKIFWYTEKPFVVYANTFDALLGIGSVALTMLANSYSMSEVEPGKRRDILTLTIRRLGNYDDCR